MKTKTFQCHYCAAPIVRKDDGRKHFCDTTCKGEWQATQKPATKELLEDLYIKQGKNCTEIAHIVQRDSKSVWNWLKRYGIPTRKRGTTGNHIYAIGVPRVLSEAGRKSLVEKGKAARAKDGRKPYLKDGKHWLHHEGAVSPMWKGGITPERQAFYRTEAWKEACKAIWAKQDAKCGKCGLDHREINRKTHKFHIHHVDSFKIVARRADPDNLVLLCRPCHLWVHSRKNTERLFLGDGH